jgi:hypothetical protein
MEKHLLLILLAVTPTGFILAAALFLLYLANEFMGQYRDQFCLTGEFVTGYA